MVTEEDATIFHRKRVKFCKHHSETNETAINQTQNLHLSSDNSLARSQPSDLDNRNPLPDKGFVTVVEGHANNRQNIEVISVAAVSEPFGVSKAAFKTESTWSSLLPTSVGTISENTLHQKGLLLSSPGILFVDTNNIMDTKPSQRIRSALSSASILAREILFNLYSHKRMPRLSNEPYKNTFMITLQPPSPHVSWPRDAALDNTMGRLILCNCKPQVNNTFVSNQGTFSPYVVVRLVESALHSATTANPTKTLVIPEAFVQVVHAILEFHKRKEAAGTALVRTSNKRGFRSQNPFNASSTNPLQKSSVASTKKNLENTRGGDGAKVKLRVDESQTKSHSSPVKNVAHMPLFCAKLAPSFLEVQRNDSCHGVYERRTPSAEFHLNLTDEGPPDLQSPQSHADYQPRNQSMEYVKAGQCGNIIHVVPPSNAPKLKHLRPKELMNELDGKQTTLARQVYRTQDMQAIEDCDDDRRARKRAKKENKRARKLEKRRSENDSIIKRESSVRKRTKKESRAGNEDRSGNLMISLSSPENANYGCEDYTLAENSIQNDVELLTRDDQGKTHAPVNRWCDPRIQNRFPNPVPHGPLPLKDQVDRRYQITRSTHHSRSGRELNPPSSMPVADEKRTPQASNVTPPLKDVIPRRENTRPPLQERPYQHTTETQTASHTFDCGTPTAPLPAHTDSLSFLCSESFIGSWSQATAELASGSWSLSLLPNQCKDMLPSPIGRRISLQDTPLLDEMGVDIEFGERGALVVCSLASWKTLDVRSQVRKYIMITAFGKYEYIDFILCADAEISPSLAAQIALLQNSLLCGGGNCVACFHTVSPKTLSSTLAHRILGVGAQCLTFIDDLGNDDRVEQRARFLLAVVPSLTVTGALSILRSAGQDNDNPLSEEGSRLGIQKLLGDKGYLEKRRDEIKSGQASGLIDLGTINQLAIASLAPLIVTAL